MLVISRTAFLSSEFHADHLMYLEMSTRKLGSDLCGELNSSRKKQTGLQSALVAMQKQHAKATEKLKLAASNLKKARSVLRRRNKRFQSCSRRIIV